MRERINESLAQRRDTKKRKFGRALEMVFGRTDIPTATYPRFLGVTWRSVAGTSPLSSTAKPVPWLVTY